MLCAEDAMSLAEFLPRLLEHGEVRFSQRPTSLPSDRVKSRTILAEAYENYRLDIAGPLIPFDAEIALTAAEVVQMACWFLVNRATRGEEVKQAVQLAETPRSAAAHL